MSPVSLEPRRNIKNKKQSKRPPSWLTDVALAMLGEEHIATVMTPGRRVHAWWLQEQEVLIALAITMGTMPQATNGGT